MRNHEPPEVRSRHDLVHPGPDSLLVRVSYAGGVMPPSRDGLDPRTFSNESWSYTDSSGGRLDAFWGLEEILHRGEQVSSCRYAGGVLR
jgi:hypothetical protein